METKETLEGQTPDYKAGREGRSDWFIPDELDPSKFIGKDEQKRIKEANATIWRHRQDYRRGLIDFLKGFGVEKSDAENIASAPGIDGFKLALEGQQLPQISPLDASRFIDEEAQRSAKKLNWTIFERRQGYEVGLRVRGRQVKVTP